MYLSIYRNGSSINEYNLDHIMMLYSGRPDDPAGQVGQRSSPGSEEHRIASPRRHQPPTAQPGAGAPTADPAEAERIRKQEEEELQLAIAISQSEADAKERDVRVLVEFENTFSLQREDLSLRLVYVETWRWPVVRWRRAPECVCAGRCRRWIVSWWPGHRLEQRARQ